MDSSGENMGFREMVASRGHRGPGLGVMEGEATHDTIETHHERQVDKSQLISQASALASAAAVGLARLQSKGGSSAAISQLERVQSQAAHVLSALESNGTFQLSVCAGELASISGELNYDESSTASTEDSSTDKDAPKRGFVLTPEQMVAVAAADPLMQVLTSRNDELEGLKTGQAALEAHAVSSAQDAKMDMDATVQLASMRYSGKSPEEIDAYLAATKEQMLERTRNLAAYQGAPEELIEKNVNERFAVIQEEAQRVEMSMHLGGNATARSLSAAAEDIVDLHARHLKAHSTLHYNLMDAHMKGYMDSEFMDASKERMAALEQDRHNMHHTLKDMLEVRRGWMSNGSMAEIPPVQGDPEEYLRGVMQSSSINKVFDEGIERGGVQAAKWHQDRTFLQAASEKILDDRADVYAALYGKNGNIDAVADALGMKKADVVKDVAAFQNANDVAFPSAAELKQQAGALSALLGGRGAGAGLPDFQ